MRCQSLSFVSVSSSTSVRLSSKLRPNAKTISERKIRRPKNLSIQLRKSKMLEMLEKQKTMLEGNKSSLSNSNSRTLRDRSERKD